MDAQDQAKKDLADAKEKASHYQTYMKEVTA